MMKAPKVLYIVIPLILFFALGVYAFHRFRMGPAIVQPLNFSHKFHTETMGIECKRCHTGIESGYAAVRPNIKTCSSCKPAILNGGQTKAKKKLAGLLAKKKKKTLSENETIFLDYLQKNKHIEWKPIYRLNRHVYFSHRRHVKFAKLKCNECHGEIGKSEALPEHPIIKTLFMTNCLRCHEEKKASQDCTSCHR